MERCQVTIAGKAIGVNLMRSEWPVSACQAGIYSRNPGELFLTPTGCTHTRTHTRICISTNTCSACKWPLNLWYDLIFWWTLGGEKSSLRCLHHWFKLNVKHEVLFAFLPWMSQISDVGDGSVVCLVTFDPSKGRPRRTYAFMTLCVL